VKTAKRLSLKALARLDGTAPVTVRRARQAGRIVADADGRYDPMNPVNREWLARSKQTEWAAPPLTDRLSAASARLRNLEYDVLVRRWFYIERAPVAGWLHKTADLILTELRAFPEERVVEFLCIGQSPEQFVPILRRHMGQHIEDMGDQHAAIEKALDQAAARWRGHRPEPDRDGPKVPPWDPPATLAEARSRHAAAVGELEDMKLRVRIGELMADWPARKAVGDLLIGWQQQCMEHFGVRHGVLILAEAGITASKQDQWNFFNLLRIPMRVLLQRVDRKIADDPDMGRFATHAPASPSGLSSVPEQRGEADPALL
jgi:hypothetical protein